MTDRKKRQKKTFFLSFPLSLTEEQTQTNGITFFFLQDSVGGGFFFGSSQVHFRKVIESFLIITAAAIRLNLVNWFSLLSRVIDSKRLKILFAFASKFKEMLLGLFICQCLEIN